MALALHIVLQKPPLNFDYSLQKGSGNQYEFVDIQRSYNHDLDFKLTVELKGDRNKDAQPDFKGPFVQGPLSGRFIYINIGEKLTGIHGLSTRRLKIPLSGITWEMTDQAQANPQAALRTHVTGTKKDGTPNCATVKPFEGWAVVLS